jgi:hypothetical protein
MKFKFLFILSFISFSIFGQKSISGRVIGEYLDIPFEVFIHDKDSNLLGKCDFDGYFKIELPSSSNELYFSGIEFERTKIVVNTECNYLEVILLNQAIYDFISLNKIDRLRKKSFKKLNDIRQQAVKEKLFEYDAACYTQEFESIKNRN